MLIRSGAGSRRCGGSAAGSTGPHVKLCCAAQRDAMSATIFLAATHRCRRLVQKECSRACPETSNPRVAAVARRGLCCAGREHPVPDGCFERQDQRHRSGAVRMDGRAVCGRSQSRACSVAHRLLACSLGCLAESAATGGRSPVTACRTAPPTRDRTTGSTAGLARASWHRSAQAPDGLPVERQHPRP